MTHNFLLNVLVDHFKVMLVEENGESKTDSMLVELQHLQISKFFDPTNPNSSGVRFLLSQLSLYDVIQERHLFRLYKGQKSTTDIILPLPACVLTHPIITPLPDAVHVCGTVVARYPPPPPPVPCFEYTIRALSCELLVERDGIERLITFALQAHLLNAELPLPSERDYANAEAFQSEARVRLPGIEQDDIYYEMDLLPSQDALIKFDCSSEEFKVAFLPTGGKDKPYPEFVVSGVHLTGDPEARAPRINEDFLTLRSPKGTPLIQKYDFFYKKFHDDTVEHTPKFHVEIPKIALNWVQKRGEAGTPIFTMQKISAFFKLYSLLKFISDPATIPQIECDLYAHDASFEVFESQHVQLLEFLKDHFVYGASSNVKEMLEKEVKKLATDMNPKPRGMEYLTKNKILKVPTYLLNISMNQVSVVLKDDSKDLFHMLISSTSSAVEKHADRLIVVGKLGDVRAWSIPGNDLLKLVKSQPTDITCTRTEWRTFAQGKSPTGGANTTHMLGDLRGLQLNVSMETVYHCLDYLVNILGDTLILAEETAGSNYMMMMGKYAEILFVTGLPSEANNYWRSLREVSLFAEQLYAVIGAVVWDVYFGNFTLTLGDPTVQFKLLDCESVQITTVTEPSGKDVTAFKLQMGRGGITQNSTEEPFCNPFAFSSEWTSEKNPEWKEGSPDTVPQFLRSYSIGMNELAVFFKPEHFTIASKFFASHVKAFQDTCQKLIHKVEGRAFQATPLVTQEDATVVAQGITAQNESPNNVNALRKALIAQKKVVDDAQAVQFELSSQNAELQMKNMDLESKVQTMQQKLDSMHVALQEMQEKLINLQMSQL